MEKTLQNQKTKLWKRILSIVLAVIIGFGTFVVFTFGNSRFQKWLGINSVLSAYAAEMVDTKGAVAVDEEAMLADDHTINLENKDGSNTVYLFSEPISYTDENGNLKTKDISVEKADKKLKSRGYEYTNGQNDYRINFSKDYNTGVQAEFDNCSYSIIPISDYDIVGKETVAEYLNEKFEVFQYKNIYGDGTNLRFYPQLNGIKDEIVLDSNIGKNIFSFKIETNNCIASLDDDGAVVLKNTDDEVVQTFSKPFAYDSDFVDGIYDEHYVDCEYTLDEISNGSYMLSISVDKNWLESDSTSYPVVIDPTTGNFLYTEDAGIYTGKPTNNYGNEQTGCMGLDKGYGYGRVVTYFPMPTYIKKAATIHYAYSWQRETTGATSSTYIRPYVITSGWNETKVTWNTRPNYTSGASMPQKLVNSKSTDKADNVYWYKFDIAPAIRAWVNRTYTNYGLYFISSNDLNNTYGWRAFASRTYNTSAMRPYYVISYTNDLVAPTVTSVTGNASDWTNGNVTLKVNGAKDNNGGIGLHTTTYSFSTSKDTYNWQKENYKTFSSNCTVYIYVRDAWDNRRLVSTQTINKIDKDAPSTPTVTGNSEDWTTDKVTLTASSSDSASGIKDYSFSTTQGVYSWQTENTKQFDENATVYVYARDNAGNISAASEVVIDKITTNPDFLIAPQFYESDNLVGIYNPRRGSESMLYKIGEDGEWQKYEVPFAIPFGQTVNVYAKFESSSDYEISGSFTSNVAYAGAYGESNTDFTLSYRNIGFDFTRSYNSIDKKWHFATDSKVTPQNDYVIKSVMPDGSKLTFVKSAANTYTEELNDYTLTVNDGGYVINVNSVNYTYDNNGNIISVGNKYGDTVNVARNDNNIIVSDKTGRAYTLTLNDNKNIISVTDPADNSIQYTYDSDNNLTKVVDQAGVIIGQYEYKNGVLSKSMDKTVNYTADGRVQSYVYDSGAYLNYTYDDENKTISTVSSVETTSSQGFDDALLTVSSTDEDGKTTEYTYDNHYRKLSETADGKTVTYSYDGNGRLISEVSNDENAENTYYTYDSNGNVVRQQTGKTYTYSVYNDIGEVVLTASLKDGYSGEIPEIYNSDLTCFDTVNYTYDNGMLTKTVDSKSTETVTYLYNDYGNAIKTSTVKTENDSTTLGTTDSTYDLFGNVLTTVSGDKTSSYIYDNAGRTLLANDNGECTRTVYDNKGRTVREIGPEDYDSAKDGLPENNTYSDTKAGKTFVYAANGTLTRESNRLGKITKYYYNDIGSKIREEFDIYKFYYLNHGELYQVKVAGVTTVTYSYDNEFRLLSESYANDDVIRYSYNSNGDVIAQYKNDNSKPYVTYTYNEDNNLTQKVNNDTGLKYVYGENDKVEVYRISDNTLVQSYVEAKTEADEENGIEAKTDVTESHFGNSISYTTKNKSVEYTNGGNTVSYSYTVTGADDNEKINASTVKYNGNSVLSSSYTYDNKGNVLTKSYGENTTVTNTYDSKDRITSTSFAGKSVNYTYDSNGQLLSANDDTYTYDSRGNITSKTVGDTVTNFTYANTGWKDLLISVDDTELEYDANGNVILYGDREFTWTYGRSLASVLDGMDEYTYTYDENGIRTSKTVDGVTTYYNTKDGVILSQTDGENTWYFQYDTSGTPLGFVFNGTQYFYITNQMNDVLAITDTNGDIVGNYEYDAWGKVLTADTDLAKQNPLRYRGYYYDNETGYYYLQSRYYDSSICRFINADEYQISQNSKEDIIGLNIFVYCANNSVNHYDFDGHKRTSVSFKNVYIFYDPDDFYRQAKDEQKYWRKKIRYSIVSLVSIKNRSSFIKYWNYNVRSNSIVVWMFHGSPNGIHTTSDNFVSKHVSSLSNFNIDTLYIYACNCGHLDVKNNIATRIARRLTRTKKIYAMDGSISYYLNSKKYTGYKPRLSVNQSHYYYYARTVTIRNRYGSIFRYKRSPIGLYRVK